MVGIEKFIESVCVQPTVYWEVNGLDGFGGRAYKNPVEIYVRWDHETRVVKSTNGEELIVKGKILTTQDLTVQGLLTLGSLADFTPLQLNDPKSIPEVYEIVLFSKIPMIKSTTVFVRTAYVGATKNR